MSQHPNACTLAIEGVRELGTRLKALDLRVVEGAPAFLPGQYLLLRHPDGTRIAFSLASAPARLPLIELHYMPQQDSDDTRHMDEILAARAPVQAEVGLGRCGIRFPLPRELIIIAGGTGITQARSILQAAADTEPGADIRLFWGARRREDLYLADELDRLTAGHPRLHWQAALEDPDPGSLVGRVGTAVAGLCVDGALDLTGRDVLLAGGPPMVWGTVAALREVGLDAGQTLSDVFEYAPRDDLWD